MPKLRLLVLAVGTQVGQNVLASLARRRADLALIGTSSGANEPALFDFDSVYLVPETRRDPQGFDDALCAVLEREQVDLVIPCRDDDVLHLAGLAERRPDLAPRLLTGSVRGAQIIGDKWLSHEFCVEHGLPFAASMIDGSNDAGAFVREHGLPMVAKPRRGFASTNVHLLFKEEQVRQMLGREDYIVQQFLGDASRIQQFLDELDRCGLPLFHSFEGLKHSIQALIGPDGSVVHVICTRNVRYMRRSKWVQPDEDPAAPEIGRRCAEAFASIGWRGPLNIQCERARSGELRIHEFNGRFTSGTIDRFLLGLDEVGAAIEHFTGRAMPFDRAPVAAALESFSSRVARAADPAAVAQLTRDRVWHRSAR